MPSTLPAPAPESAARFARHGLQVAAFNTALGGTLALSRGGDWVVHMIYAQSIGLSIWSLIDFGRFAFKRDPQTGWPDGWRRIALQVAGIVGGYIMGNVLAYAVSRILGYPFYGKNLLDIWSGSPRAVLGYLIMSLAVSAAISFFFYARGKDQYRLRQLAAAQRDAAEIQLKLLESQLEPHMLFNTLANLRVLIGVDPPRAQLMLDRMIGFLRASLSASRTSSHPLSAEFARVADYLDLMKIRMGERLQPQLELPPELSELQVPPLVLQPLVENAIKHGLEPHVQGGRLQVSARREQNQLVLCVRDTGAGLSQTRSEGTRFGLTQVRQRLDSLYGPAASFELASATDTEGGTLATVRLPLPLTA